MSVETLHAPSLHLVNCKLERELVKGSAHQSRWWWALPTEFLRFR